MKVEANDDDFKITKPKDEIVIRGARQHNLKNINLDIPRDKFVVLTGLSGSGKSSLAFDTIYAEGQRRYIESLSAYARQFLGQMDKPDVDYIEGLSPAISIEQRSAAKNPRSTVSTVTEIHDYLRLMFSRIGVPHCPNCRKTIARQTVEQMVDQVMKLKENTKIQVLAPIIKAQKGEHKEVFKNLKKQGYSRVRVDQKIRELEEQVDSVGDLEKNKKHTIEVVIDRLIVKPGIEKRLSDSIQTALGLAKGTIVFDVNEDMAQEVVL
ncbi:MAG: excinuclease ABC subunit UvrA, partial [Rhabdochlamydiaceae bacterium]